ncbi:MAG: hypothetical protein ACLP01_26630 [Solirubrobacteraceae bacterium]
MSARSVSIAPIAAFGDLATDVWGVVLGAGVASVTEGDGGRRGARGAGHDGLAGVDPVLAIGSVQDGERPQWTPVTLKPDPDGQWTVSGAGHAFTIAAQQSSAATSEAEVVLQLCRVRGAVQRNGAAVEVECHGARCASARSTGSLRFVATWFENDAALALLASRPAGAKGHDLDVVAAAVQGEGPQLTVFDPRLSTTYGGDGAPARMGIEMWLGATEEGDLSSRRVAGEVTQPGTSISVAGVMLEALALRCHSRGAPGAGVYVIARPEQP